VSIAVAATLVVTGVLTGSAGANTANPSSVTVAGSLQSEAGCPGDWDPACAATHLTYHASDDVWQGSWTLPAGSHEYKAALNDSWDENYGLHGIAGGANIPLSLGSSTSVKFYYDHKTHWITDNLSSVIAVAAGSFQSELGCPGDWQPDCLRSWLQDADGDGIYTFVTTALPAGSYEAKAAINESWDENYGQGGVANGANIPFTVAVDNQQVTFRYDSTTHVLTIVTEVVKPPTVTKRFAPSTTIPLNGTTFLLIGVTNPNSTTTLTGIAVTDSLPTGLVVTPPFPSGSTCGGGTLTSTATSITVTNITLQPNATLTCFFFVGTVQATTPGTKINTTSAPTSNESGAGTPSTATLVVLPPPQPPTLTKAFSPATVRVGATTTLTFTLLNPNAATSLTGMSFTDPLPLGLRVATPNGLVNTCGGIAQAVAGSGALSLSGVSLPPSGNCFLQVNVRATNSTGVKNNQTTPVTSNEAGLGNRATASITVTP
jgi:uncharacterized repeat protein (TIGR01451 family)